MFTFTSIVPPEQVGDAQVRASLLTFENDVRILADPGWDTRSDLSHLESIINSIDLILLSHPSMPFLGAYAYLYKKIPAIRSIPVYSTSPVSNLGRVESIESYRTVGLVGPVTNYQMELNDIEEAFDHISPLKHNQSTTLRGKFDNLTITAINAGHTLGGIIWLFNKNNEKIIYAPAWNHSKDSYLEGAKILQENGNPLPSLARPSAMITSAMIGSTRPYNKRVEKFLSLVDATLQNSGTVLLPISLGSRLLELVHLVDDHLRSLPYQVYLLARTGTRALTYAGSTLEWMSPAVTKEWHLRGKVPFAASTVTLIDHFELERLQGSKVVFCCGAGLETGSPAFESFIRLCNDPTTTVLLTERAEKGTLAYDLYHYWEKAAAQRNNGKVEDGVAVPYQSNIQVAQVTEEFLVGKELEEYNEMVKQKREADKELKQKLEKKGPEMGDQEELLKIDDKKILRGDDDDDDEEDEEDEDSDNDNEEAKKRAKKARKQIKEKEENLKENLPLDIDVRNSKGKNRMFPYVPKRYKFDDYGEVINPKDFAKKESKFDLSNSRNNRGENNKIGEKRKFGQDSLSSRKLAAKKKTKEKVAKTDEMTDLTPLHEPRKQIVKHLSILTKCGLVYVDLAGLVDLRSLSLIVPSLKPRKLLLLSDLTDPNNTNVVYNQLNTININRNRLNIHGNPSLQYGNNNALNNKLFDLIQVQNNHEVDIGDAIASFEIVLDDSIANSLKWQKITGGFSIAQVIGTIVRRSEIEEEDDDEEEEGEEKREQKVEELKKEDGDKDEIMQDDSKVPDVKTLAKEGLGLKVLTEDSAQLMNIRHTPLAIGDIKLKELKDLYSYNGHRAEFKGEGTLAIDDQICIRKINEGDFVVEGTPCTLFYEVREKVRNMLAYV